ncbi:hypothetical protein Bhyg_06753 [Pseudolycoriella hygida]|uniref:Uncharacterized protein n=1 Tax=Pseudolycoriella hygida TaxID=35572 RepID=A0A9Q0N1E1_9DIPT|nr:hypothetical protein Bhyg_06753 [Pseudolycoriella hygida]
MQEGNGDFYASKWALTKTLPVSDSSVQSENASKCKKLCGFCGCTGFYCGDECLCECNSITDGTAECVDTMKSNCKKLDLPFEVLIQGPNVNRMVRSLLYADPNEESCQSSESNHKRRSTISIYKPHAIQQQDEFLSVPKMQEAPEEEITIPIVAVHKQDPKGELEKMEMDSQAKEMTAQNMEDVAVEMKDDADMKPHSVDEDSLNVKRHIIDINQDLSGLMSDFDDSLLFKRDAEGDTPKPEEPKPEEPKPAEGTAEIVGAPRDAAPAAPKVRGAFDNIKTQIPTSDEIKAAWEGVPPPAPVPNDVARTIAAGRAALLPIQSEIARSLEAFRVNNRIIQGNAIADTNDLINNFGRNRWFLPSLIVGAPNDEEPPKEEPPKEDPPKLPKKE